MLKGIWAENEDVYESAIFSEYHGMVISLLIFPDDPPIKHYRHDDGFGDSKDFDTYDQFQRNSRVTDG